MKKFFALVLSFCLFCGIAFAEGETSENTNTGENKQGSLNLGSLPERKTKSSLEDVLSAQDADRIQKAISDALVSFAEKMRRCLWKPGRKRYCRKRWKMLQKTA